MQQSLQQSAHKTKESSTVRRCQSNFKIGGREGRFKFKNKNALMLAAHYLWWIRNIEGFFSSAVMNWKLTFWESLTDCQCHD